MALPKLTAPEYFLVVPSTGEEIPYRPFLVKEEKVLLIALEGENQKEINNAVLNLVRECTFGKIGTPTTPMFDVEYAFLQIRAKSVGEVSELNVLCPDDKKTRVDVSLNLSEVQIQMNKDHSTTVELTDEIILKMKYPTLNDTVVLSNKGNAEGIFELISNCISEVHHGDDVTNMIDVSDKDKTTFIDSMTQEMFEKVQNFFETMPKLRHVLEVKNPKTKKKNEVLLEGLADFFA